MKATVPLIMGTFEGLKSMLPERGLPVKISSHKIEGKKEERQLSKQKLLRMKGKKARKNRGKNRKPQDTALYASLRR